LSRPGRFILLGILALVAFLGGCASNQATSSNYNAQFASGRYSEAYETSSKVALSMKAIDRDQASLVAGLSARALGRKDDAKHWLTPLTFNADPAITGKASVALGAIAHEEGRNKEAADLFTKAGNRLTGDDAAHALMCAGDSLKALRKPAEATEMYEQAKAKVVSDQQLRIEIGDRLAGAGPVSTSKASPSKVSPAKSTVGGRYTVQTGAFSTLKKAKTEAKKYTSQGSTKAIPITDGSGKKLYAVQVGRFSTKQDAEMVRRSVGNGAIVAQVVD
jgi:cell division septation protein DedD